MMETNGMFADYDDEQVYNNSQTRALREETNNFVVEFGKEGARVAFDLQQEDVQSLLDTPAPAERPVRWINIWAPHKQVNIVNLLGKQYKFSPRLLAIIHSSPPEPEERRSVEKHGIRFRAKAYLKDDVEVGTHSMDSTRPGRQTQGYDSTSHYSLAAQMVNYQSVDIGAHFLCIGANWMYEQSPDFNEEGIVTKGKQKRLWSWLVFCDDNTVITFREHPGQIGKIEDLKSTRSNTLSIFSQLSKIGHSHADPISMQTIRQVLDMDSNGNPGLEGASNLFFYLFDDWRAVYSTVAIFHQTLDSLQNEIFDDMNRRSNSPPKMNIIRSLHILGRQLRESQGLYTGYENLIRRILEPKISTHFGINTPRTFSGLTADHRRITLAQSAAQRFERLGDRIELLILSEIREFLAEKDALINTYFNINAQKDSEQNARLTRSATLLAKLSVLFLPVSLLTGYFSIQVQDLEGVYTVKDYWYAFAVLMCISFMFLFFFARLLMWVSETLDARVKMVSLECKAWFRRRLRKDKEENEKQ